MVEINGRSNFHFIPPLTSCQVAKLWQSRGNWYGARLTLNNNMPFEEEEKKNCTGSFNSRFGNITSGRGS